MNGRVIAAVTGILAMTISVSAASGGSGVQQLTITAKYGVEAFVLMPQTHGSVSRDSGSVAWCCWSRRFVTRDGQKAEINDPIATLTGKHGTLVIRFRIEWLDAGRGYTVARAPGRSCAVRANVFVRRLPAYEARAPRCVSPRDAWGDLVAPTRPGRGRRGGEGSSWE
jgi:hypothetical protein